MKKEKILTTYLDIREYLSKSQSFYLEFLNKFAAAIADLDDEKTKNLIEEYDEKFSQFIVKVIGESYTQGHTEGSECELDHFAEYMKKVAQTLDEESKMLVNKAVSLVYNRRKEKIREQNKGKALQIFPKIKA